MTAAWCIAFLLAAGDPAHAHGASLFPPEPGAGQAAPAIAHPRIVLVDADGEAVIRSGRPVSTMRTCGACHDTDYIATHSYHALAGADDAWTAGTVSTARPWDSSPGWYGRWNPLTYRVLTPPGDDRIDMGTADWIRVQGDRHPGGGPAARAGRDARALDPATGDAVAWDWTRSGTVELDCFLCHLTAPDNDARVRALRAGRFDWAATAALESTGIVAATADGWRWTRGRFDADGHPDEGFAVTAPTSRHCGTCHGLVHEGDDPVLPRYGLGEWATETQGQIFSPQRIAASAMNIAGKDTLSRPWDVHAERLLACTSCHYSVNNPAYVSENGASRPTHLDFDSRRQDISEFLKRPNHELAKGHSAQGTVAASLDGSMRGCAVCHDAVSTHGWLPYTRRHMDRLMCESCPVPRVYAPARRVTDWTVLTPGRGPRVEYRGVDGRPGDPAALIEGFRPALLARVVDGGLARLGPHHLVASWFWVTGDPPRPVRQRDLEIAFFGAAGAATEVYAPEIVAAFDRDGDARIDEAELVLDSREKVDAVRARLEAVGVDAPRIDAELQPFSLGHGVATGRWAVRTCDDCHSRASIVSAPVELASVAPGGVEPRMVGDANVAPGGAVRIAGGGRVEYVPAPMAQGFYVLGHDRWRAGDRAGVAVIFAVLVGALVHGGVRHRYARRRRNTT